MKSKCYFDLNENDECVIRAEIVTTDDIRDKVAKRFYEKLGYESNLAVVRFFPDIEEPSDYKYLGTGSSGNGTAKVMEIKTVGNRANECFDWMFELSIEQLNTIRVTIDAVLERKNAKNEIAKRKAAGEYIEP